MKNTFVITVDEDVTAFLERKTGNGTDANAYINQLLDRERQRQDRSRNNTQEFPQNLDALLENTPDAAR